MQVQAGIAGLTGALVSGASRLDLDLAKSVLVAAGVAVSFANINAGRAETLQVQLESHLNQQVDYLIAELEPIKEWVQPVSDFLDPASGRMDVVRGQLHP